MLLTNENLGQQITYHREKLKLSQKELATITGVRPKHISDIERGRMVRIYTLARLAAGLRVTMEELVGRG